MEEKTQIENKQGEIEVEEEESPIKTEEARGRDEKGLFEEGNTIGQFGRKPDTPEDKKAKKAMKVLIKEYREKLSEALPEISPVLVEKALKGDMAAIRELHEVIGSHAPKQTDITSKGEAIIVGMQIQNDTGKNPNQIQNEKPETA